MSDLTFFLFFRFFCGKVNYSRFNLYRTMLSCHYASIFAFLCKGITKPKLFMLHLLDFLLLLVCVLVVFSIFHLRVFSNSESFCTKTNIFFFFFLFSRFVVIFKMNDFFFFLIFPLFFFFPLRYQFIVQRSRTDFFVVVVVVLMGKLQLNFEILTFGIYFPVLCIRKFNFYLIILLIKIFFDVLIKNVYHSISVALSLHCNFNPFKFKVFLLMQH